MPLYETSSSPCWQDSALSCQQEPWDGRQFHHDGKDDQRGQGNAVQDTQDGAAQKPANPIPSGEEAIGRGTSLDRHHRCDGGWDNRLVDANAQPPQRDADQRDPEAAQKGKGSEQGCQQGKRNQDEYTHFIEQSPEEQGADPSNAHRHCIEDRHPGAWDDGGSGKVVSDQREVGKPGGDQHGPREVQPKGRRQASRVHVWGGTLQLFRTGVGDTCSSQDAQSEKGGDEQESKSQLILTA